MVEITNTEPWTSKTITNSGEGVPKNWLISFIRGTIKKRDNPRRRNRVREDPCRNIVFVCYETFNVNAKAPGKNKSTFGA
jgi:hypothetical protein